VLNTILGGGMSSRLNQNIREKYGYCYNIYSFVNLHSDTGDFGVYMGTDASKVQRSEKLILRELEKLADIRVSPRTLSQAKNQVKGSIMLGLESMSNRMMRLGRQELVFERYFSLDEVLEELDSVTAEAVQESAQALFVPENFSSVVLVPEEERGRGVFGG
jgi:predicted Zn-dependent peptidase